jgi:hypothetical protein
MIPRVIRPFGLHGWHGHHHHPFHVSRRDMLLKSAGAFGLTAREAGTSSCSSTPTCDSCRGLSLAPTGIDIRGHLGSFDSTSIGVRLTPWRRTLTSLSTTTSALLPMAWSGRFA